MSPRLPLAWTQATRIPLRRSLRNSTSTSPSCRIHKACKNVSEGFCCASLVGKERRIDLQLSILDFRLLLRHQRKQWQTTIRTDNCDLLEAVRHLTNVTHRALFQTLINTTAHHDVSIRGTHYLHPLDDMSESMHAIQSISGHHPR